MYFVVVLEPEVQHQGEAIHLGLQLAHLFAVSSCGHFLFKESVSLYVKFHLLKRASH